MDDREEGRLPFLDRPLSPSFRRHEVTIDGGGAKGYDPADWRDALVVVERGAVELECTKGGRQGFKRGDVLWLADLGVVAFHNPGTEPLVLVAIQRRPPPTVGGSPAH